MPQIKPPIEETEAELEKTKQDLETMQSEGKDKEGDEEAEVTPQDKEEDEDKENHDEKSKGEGGSGDEGADEKNKDGKEDEVEDVDYKKKFVESTKEAQVLYAKNKKLAESIEKAQELLEVSDRDLRTEYPQWESMSEIEQKFATDNLLNKMKFDLVHQAVMDGKKVDEWMTKVDEWVTDPKVLQKYQNLDGREDEFKAFSMKPTRRGLDFEDLAAAFLYEYKPTKHKGEIMPTGSGGPKTQPKAKKLSIEEARELRKTDSKKWKELLQAGKIEMEI